MVPNFLGHPVDGKLYRCKKKRKTSRRIDQFEVGCVGAYSISGTLSLRGINPIIKLAYKPSRPDGWLL